VPLRYQILTILSSPGCIKSGSAVSLSNENVIVLFSSASGVVSAGVNDIIFGASFALVILIKTSWAAVANVWSFTIMVIW